MNICTSWASWYWTTVLTLCVVSGGGDWGDCGHLKICICKWSSGKKSASCPSAGLRAPPALSYEIQVLDLRDNALFDLPSEVFAAAGLLNLQRVNLSKSRIRSINKNAFHDLRILIELDLSDNELNEIPIGTFHGNERLRLLVLSGNPLVTLPSDQFPPLPHLRNLELVDCRLKSVHARAFSSLTSIESIDLRRNLLMNLRRTIFVSLPALKTLSLSENPWRCDCRLRDFCEWYVTSNLGTEEVLCVDPVQHADTRWRDINVTNMTCVPEVTPSTRVLRAESGTDVRFGCMVRGDPLPRVTWSLDGLEIDNETSAVIIEENYFEAIEEELEKGVVSGVKWVNVTINNVTSTSAGEWNCLAQSLAGYAQATISLVLPRARTATARSPPEYSPVFGVLAGSLGALFTLSFVMTCVCLLSRRRRLPPSRSFNDQEKKLLDSSIIASCDRSSTDLGSFELSDNGMSIMEPNGLDPVHITIEGLGGAGFPPPPAEFALKAPYSNIFISVSVGGQSRECPDLLGYVGGTLPRRTRTCCSVPTYDNMGPRVTAAGSSTWSLPGADVEDNRKLQSILRLPPIPATPPPHTVLDPPPPPPMEFVSL